MKTQKVDLEGTATMKDRTIVEQQKVQSAIEAIYAKIYEKEMKRIEKQNLKKQKQDEVANENSKNQQEDNDEDYEDIPNDEHLEDDDPIPFGTLDKIEHSKYLRNSLFNLKFNIRHYDCGHPWVIYWIVHAIQVLNEPTLNIKVPLYQKQIIDFLNQTQDPNGGFCGGNYQFPHSASSYAAISSLVEIGTEDAFKIIDRQGMYNYLIRCRDPEIKGRFLLCEGGECDMRGVYVAVVIADILNIMTDELLDGVADFIVSSQTYEGGIGPEPFCEAHGGMNFCGFAALMILKQTHRLNLNKLINWLSQKQMQSEGGFQGRTNKLVDNCYSYWQGAAFRLVAEATNMAATYKNHMLFDQMRLQAYILLCQDEKGGLYDKPGKNPDLYHTCYSLSGLSSAQLSADEKEEHLFMGISSSITNKINVAYNLSEGKLENAKQYFKLQPAIKHNHNQTNSG